MTATCRAVIYANLVRMPLRTIHQPCDELGATAIRSMFQRIERPEIPARGMLVSFHMAVRESCDRAASFREPVYA
jgi:GntR family transcriptional regulator, arabinose operon transcriptional repressor